MAFCWESQCWRDGWWTIRNRWRRLGTASLFPRRTRRMVFVAELHEAVIATRSKSPKSERSPTKQNHFVAPSITRMLQKHDSILCLLGISARSKIAKSFSRSHTNTVSTHLPSFHSSLCYSIRFRVFLIAVIKILKYVLFAMRYRSRAIHKQRNSTGRDREARKPEKEDAKKSKNIKQDVSVRAIFVFSAAHEKKK